MKKRWRLVCISCRKAWRDTFDTEYNRQKNHAKRAHEISNELMEFPFNVRMKMLKSINQKVIENTRQHLEDSMKDSQVRIQIETEKQAKINNQLTTIQ